MSDPRAEDPANLDVSQLGWGQTWPPPELYQELATRHAVVPVVRRLLADTLTPVAAFQALGERERGGFILESAEAGAWSRWSFVGGRAQALLSAKDGWATWRPPAPLPETGPTLEVIAAALAHLRAPDVVGMPPLTGGLVGSLGWDIVRQWEPTLPAAAADDLDLPEAALVLVGEMLAFDHQRGDVWLITNTFPGEGFDSQDEHHRASARLDALATGLQSSHAQLRMSAPVQRLPTSSPTTAADFKTGVDTVKTAITDGEVFQLVLSRREDLEVTASPLDVYRALRTINPSEYMYLLQLQDHHGDHFAVVGSSPETLVRVTEGVAQTYPIAGSRPRGTTPEADARLAEELLADQKERAEHIMLVDLARNDLGRVCEPGTVSVVDFMTVQRLSHIMHITSSVTGRVRAGVSAFEVLQSCFPAGTLSGAPKPRAIALIDELEPTRRGIYGGAVGYFDLQGNMDTAIAIRTAVLRRGRAHVQAGAGLVADSIPQTEYEETQNKAAAVIRALELGEALRRVQHP